MSEVQFALETFKKYGINASVINNNQIAISHFCQPKGTTFEALGIDENELIKNVAICEGKFDTTNSKLTTFELSVAKEIVLDKETNIKETINTIFWKTFKSVFELLSNTISFVSSSDKSSFKSSFIKLDSLFIFSALG